MNSLGAEFRSASKREALTSLGPAQRLTTGIHRGSRERKRHPRSLSPRTTLCNDLHQVVRNCNRAVIWFIQVDTLVLRTSLLLVPEN